MQACFDGILRALLLCLLPFRRLLVVDAAAVSLPTHCIAGIRSSTQEADLRETRQTLLPAHYLSCLLLWRVTSPSGGRARLEVLWHLLACDEDGHQEVYPSMPALVGIVPAAIGPNILVLLRQAPFDPQPLELHTVIFRESLSFIDSEVHLTPRIRVWPNSCASDPFCDAM